MALTIGLPLGIEYHDLFFRFIAYTKSKREFFLKPCGRVIQFPVGLHC
jgi:hypothetical protein